MRYNCAFCHQYNLFIQLFGIMQKVKDFFSDNKGKIAIGVGVAVAGVFTYWLIRTSKRKEKQATPIPYAKENAGNGSMSSDNSEKTSLQEIEAPNTYDQKFSRIIHQIRSIMDAHSGQITPEVIKAVIKGQYDLANQDIKALIFSSRKLRRNKIEDANQYAQLLTQYQISMEELQEKHLGSILARFNIDKAEWKQACNAWQAKTQEGEQGLSELIRTQQEKQLLSLRIPNSKPKNFLFVQEILKFKIKTLEVVSPTELGLDLAADDAARYEMIETYVNDLVFKKFNIEQEDVQYSIEQMGEKEKQQVIKYEDDIAMHMEKFITDEDAEKESNFY